MATSQWSLEPMHSELHFKVKHLMISTVTGSFTQLNSNLEMDENDLTTAQMSFSAPIASISTNNEHRDGHLKSAEFFDAEAHPELSFSGTGIEKIDGINYKVHGNLTIKGQTQPVSLNVEYGGVINDGWGNTRAGFEVEGKINRKDFGLTWSQLTETGGMVLSDDVRISANLQFVKAK